MSSEKASVAGFVARVPQRRRGRDRVASLTAAASALFIEKGFDATTMTEIAARAGASIGALYLFFPTKDALAHALLTELADVLSASLDAQQSRMAGRPAYVIADALFDELFLFLETHPVYANLIELPGDDAWRMAIRSRRRSQIAALFENATPSLPDGQPERLAVIVPQLMRVTMLLSGETPPLRHAVRTELRAMLHHHLAWPPDEP